MKHFLIIFLVGVFVVMASCRHVIIETEDTKTLGKDGAGVGGPGNLDFCIIIDILNTIDILKRCENKSQDKIS